MRRSANAILATVIVVAEVASVGLAATSASAQGSEAQQIRRQQRLILQQQRQIESNQRRLEAQNERLAARPPVEVGPVQTFPKGLLGQYPLCPIGYRYSLLFGCFND